MTTAHPANPEPLGIEASELRAMQEETLRAALQAGEGLAQRDRVDRAFRARHARCVARARSYRRAFPLGYRAGAWAARAAYDERIVLGLPGSESAAKHTQRWIEERLLAFVERGALEALTLRASAESRRVPVSYQEPNYPGTRFLEREPFTSYGPAGARSTTYSVALLVTRAHCDWDAFKMTLQWRIAQSGGGGLVILAHLEDQSYFLPDVYRGALLEVTDPHAPVARDGFGRKRVPVFPSTPWRAPVPDSPWDARPPLPRTPPRGPAAMTPIDPISMYEATLQMLTASRLTMDIVDDWARRLVREGTLVRAHARGLDRGFLEGYREGYRAGHFARGEAPAGAAPLPQATDEAIAREAEESLLAYVTRRELEALVARALAQPYTAAVVADALRVVRHEGSEGALVLAERTKEIRLNGDLPIPSTAEMIRLHVLAVTDERAFEARLAEREVLAAVTAVIQCKMDSFHVLVAHGRSPRRVAADMGFASSAKPPSGAAREAR